MDRYDERNDQDERIISDERIDRRDRIEPDDRVRTDDDREVERHGDVLGLGGAAVPKAPEDPSASHDAESVARRRERALKDEAEGGVAANREDPYRRSHGAAGIDMGAGGRGTDLSGE